MVEILKIALFDPIKSALAGKIKSMTGCNVELYVANLLILNKL